MGGIKTLILNIGKDVGKQALSFTADENINQYSFSEEQFSEGQFVSRTLKIFIPFDPISFYTPNLKEII